jgi:hypothetical protein
MEQTSSSFFATACQQPDQDLIEKLGITAKDLWRFLTNIIQRTETTVKKLNKSNFYPINAVYNLKFSDTLQVNVAYILKNAEKIKCLSCKKFHKLNATYTFINIQNSLQFSTTNDQVHRLMHGDFKSMGQDPLHIHSVLGIGYYCEGL